jgi:ATP-dependent protease ClpP protease subunit
MSLRTLPETRPFERPRNYQWDAPADVLARWAEQPLAAHDDDGATITMFDVIGEGFFSDGVTAKRISAALRAIGKKDVTIKINSPGGDLFEGMAIYNLLRQHPARVSVQVMGWAASAASVIAMAGDDIAMGVGTFMMVHNAWGLIIGNRHDMAAGADLFAQFDSALVDVYEARTGRTRADIEKLMDAETFMGASAAVENGFADRIDEGMDTPPAAPDDSAAGKALMARRQIEAALARAGQTRDQRSQMIAELTSTAAERDAGRTLAARDAGRTLAEARDLLATIRNL